MTRPLQHVLRAMTPIAVFAVSLGSAATRIAADTSIPDNTRTILESHDGGTTVVEVRVPATSDEIASTTAITQDHSRRGSADVLWQRTLTDATYSTCAIVGTLDWDIAAGTYLNPPKEAELLAVEGDGTPTWVQPGNEFYVSASRDSDVMAGVDYDSATQTIIVHRWAAGSSTPLWSDTITGVNRGSYRTIAVSADGSTIAVLASVQDGGPLARLYLYDSASSTPIGVYDSSGGFARNLSIGADGRFVAFIGLATAYVIDRDAGTIRWSGSMGASNDPIAISTDGDLLAFGWTSLQMRQWNGTVYAPLWNVAGGDYSLKSVTFSSDSGTFAAGWHRSDYHQNRIQLFSPGDGTPLWTHLDLPGSGVYQDLPADLALTATGEILVVGGWGDIVDTNDEIQIFLRSSPDPVASVNTPGSMFDVDIALDGGSDVVITACGKHVHANESGRGGDLFSMRYSVPVAVGDAPMRPIGFEVVAANPFRAGADVILVADEATDVELGVFSATGGRVRVLGSGTFAEGRHALRWDGRDDGGHPVAPGVYVVRGRSSSGTASAKVVLTR